MQKKKVILDPLFRRIANIFTPADLARLHDAADVCWGRDGEMPDAEIEKVREDVVALIVGYWKYGDVARFPNLKAIIEVGGGFPSAKSLDYAACFSRGIRVLSCAPAFGPAVAEMALALALACTRPASPTGATRIFAPSSASPSRSMAKRPVSSASAGWRAR